MTQLPLADRIAMYIGGALLVLAIPIMGTINVLAGYESPMYVYELTKGGSTTTGQAITAGVVPEGATIIHAPLFTPNLRAYLVALALVIFGVYAAYRLFVHSDAEAVPEQRGTPSTD